MRSDAANQEIDLPPETPEEVYATLLRALQRKRGFGLFFVQCSLQKGNEIIVNLRQDLPQKRMQVLQLDRTTITLYDQIETLWQQQPFDILFIQGLENALLEYEDTKRIAGWSSQEIYSYSWKGVPRILNHLNQQRERFRDNFGCVFVFLVPFFVVKYLIQRAPDFFDWRSGLFTFSMESEDLKQETWKHHFDHDKLEKYAALTPQERKQKILEIKDLINQIYQTNEEKADLFCEQAFLWQSLEEYEQAVVCYEKALEIEPDNLLALSNRGVVLEQLGRHEEANESRSRAEQLSSDLRSPSARSYESKQAEEVLPIIDAPDYESWLNRGAELSNWGGSEAVISNTAETKEIEPVAYENGHTFSYKMSDEPYGLLSQISISHRLPIPTNSVSHGSLRSSDIWYKEGLRLDDLGQYQEAIANYNEVLRINPYHHGALRWRGIALSRLGRYQEAISNYNQALQIQPSDYNTVNWRGSALRALKRYEKAIEDHKLSVSIKPDYHYAWHNWGLALADLGQHEEAITKYDEALKIEQNQEDTWTFRGGSLGELGRYEEALASYEKALKIKDDFYLGWNERGYTLNLLGRYEEGLKSFEKALEIKSDYFTAWNNKGWSLHELGRYEEAVSSYNEALKIKSDYRLAWESRGQALYKLGRYEEILEDCEKALEIEPKYALAWNRRGRMLSNLGRYEEALVSSNKALEIEPTYAQAWFAKACCYALQQNIEKTVEALEQAIALNSNCREWIKTDSAFDRIRGEDWFQGVIEGSSRD